jgi:ABC-type transport system substrate-binding protein
MRQQFLYVLFVISFLFLNLTFISGCSQQDNDLSDKKTNSKPGPARGGLYRIPLRNSPGTLDPAFTQDQNGVYVTKQIFDGLVRFDSSLSLLPSLAETWQVSEAGKNYRFILRKNTLFHNLEKVTSEDVVFSLSRLIKADPAPAILPHLLKIEGADEYRNGDTDSVLGLKIETDQIFSVRLNSPHIPFLTALGMYQAAIVPKKEVLRLGEQFGRAPVGTGPFRFVSWEEEATIRVERFSNYFSGPAFLDEIHYKIYPGGQDPMVLADFQNGLLEEMEVFGDVKEKLKNTTGLQWFQRPSLSLFFYGMNVTHPNLSDPDLRSALSMAIDRQSFVDQVYGGQFDVARTILPPGLPGYSPDNRMPDLKPDDLPDFTEKTREIEIVSAMKTPRVELEMALMKKFWSQIGVSITVKYMTDWKAFTAYIQSGKVQIYRYVWFADMPDADSFLHPLFASYSSANFMKFRDAKVDRMLTAARGIVDPVERADIIRKTEARIMELTPLMPLFHMNVNRVYQPYIKSISISPLSVYTIPLNRIWIDNNKE